MKRNVFIRKGKIQDLDRSFDLKYWRDQPPATRITRLEEIRKEYHLWKFGVEPEFQKILRVIKH
jgi:hypothetical protein